MICRWAYTREKGLTLADFVTGHAFRVRKLRERGLRSGGQDRGVFLPQLQGEKTSDFDIEGDETGQKQGVFKK